LPRWWCQIPPPKTAFFTDKLTHIMRLIQEHITREFPSTLTSYIPDIDFWIIYCWGHPRSKVDK
jgi:hypothetical protein